MRKPLLSIGVFFLLTTPHPSFSDSSNRPFNVIGFNDMSCGAWTSSAGKNDRDVYLFWIRGFVSGFNYAHPRKEISFQDMPNQETLALYVDKYCREKPLSPFIGASVELTKELSRPREK